MVRMEVRLPHAGKPGYGTNMEPIYGPIYGTYLREARMLV
jgi:hypothetical protein